MEELNSFCRAFHLSRNGASLGDQKRRGGGVTLWSGRIVQTIGVRVGCPFFGEEEGGGEKPPREGGEWREDFLYSL